ncbi:glycosyltransferase family 4 protein [bacterium]|nr:glycosyltransferase family 4 protein [bacterium]
MIKNKKILIFSTNYFPHVGGAEMAIREICKRLPENEYHLITTKFEKGISAYEKVENVHVYRVGIGFKIDKYLFFILSQFKACSLNKKYHFDIVWAMMASYAGLATWIFKKFHQNVKYLLTLQSGDSDEFMKKRTWWWNGVYQKIYREANYIQAISNFLIDRAKRYGFEGENIELVPNGVDIQNFTKKLNEEEKRSLKNELEITMPTGRQADDNKIIISLSRLAMKNAMNDLIDSLKYLPKNYKLIICGVGPLEESLKLQAKKQGLASVQNKEDRVLFAGFVDYKELYKYLNIADVFCRPSLSEGLGNVFLESMAAKVPVIATEVGGIPDFLKNEETGLFCKVKNSKDIAEKFSY